MKGKYTEPVSKSNRAKGWLFFWLLLFYSGRDKWILAGASFGATDLLNRLGEAISILAPDGRWVGGMAVNIALGVVAMALLVVQTVVKMPQYMAYPAEMWAQGFSAVGGGGIELQREVPLAFFCGRWNVRVLLWMRRLGAVVGLEFCRVLDGDQHTRCPRRVTFPVDGERFFTACYSALLAATAR